MSVVEFSLAAAIVAGTPLLFVALGALLGEKAGVLNIGLDGIMLIGAAVGFIVAVETGSPLLGLAGGATGGALFTLVFFGVPVLALRVSQVMAGFALWFIGIGLSAQIANPYSARQLASRVESVPVPLLERLPFVGTVLFDHVWLVYAGFVLTLAVAYMLNRTRHGLNLRAIGEDPASAHAMGLQVQAWRTFYTGVCGLLGGLGGAMLSVVVLQNWRDQMTAGRGWIALALVIFAAWRPAALLWGSYLFGGFLVLSSLGQALGWNVPSPFLSMAPYVFTAAILAFRTWRELQGSGVTAAPASVGKPFVRGQR